MRSNELLVGGLVAMGFDATGRYLLTVSHSGRGVFDSKNWQRVARDDDLCYPENDQCPGIGPIADQVIAVTEMNYKTEELRILSPTGELLLEYDSGMITITPVS